MSILGLAIEPGRISAVVPGSGKPRWAAEATWADDDHLAALIADLAAERPAGSKRAVVVLAEPVARLKQVRGLPAMSRRDLQAHVRLHSRRYFLQNGIPLVTDAAAVARPDRLALLAAAPVPTIDAISRGLEAAGLACDGIHPAAGLDPGTDSPFALANAAARMRRAPLSLLPESTRLGRMRQRRRSLVRWAVLAIVSLFAALTSTTVAASRRTAAAAGELSRIEAPLLAALQVRRDLDSATAALNAISGAHAERRERSLFLARLAATLPDSAFLVTLSLDSAGGTLSGYAPNAAGVLALLERRGVVTQARFQGPLTREMVNGREYQRFSMTFRAAP